MNDNVDLLKSMDLDKIHAASRNAAWGSLVGGLIVIVAIVFSVLKIQALDKTVAARSQKIEDLEGRIGPLEEKSTDLKRQIAASVAELKAKGKELDALESKLKTARKEEQIAQAKSGAFEKQLDVARGSKNAFEKLVDSNFAQLDKSATNQRPRELLKVGVVPMTKAKLKSPENSTSKAQFSFSLWLDYRNDQIRNLADVELESVVYTFNHISFGKEEKDRQMISTDKTNGFRVGYTGWGAMKNVIIQLNLRDGTSARLDFDMHAALPRKLDVPVKGEPKPVPPAYRD